MTSSFWPLIKKFHYFIFISRFMPQDVYSNNIEGTIPEEIGLMSNLMYLNLGKNSLTGTIPQDFCNFPILETINLSENNNLQGSSQCLCDTDTNDML